MESYLPELLQFVLIRLHVDEIQSCYQVCKHWKCTVDSEFWKQYAIYWCNKLLINADNVPSISNKISYICYAQTNNELWHTIDKTGGPRRAEMMCYLFHADKPIVRQGYTYTCRFEGSRCIASENVTDGNVSVCLHNKQDIPSIHFATMNWLNTYKLPAWLPTLNSSRLRINNSNTIHVSPIKWLSYGVVEAHVITVVAGFDNRAVVHITPWTQYNCKSQFITYINFNVCSIFLITIHTRCIAILYDPKLDAYPSQPIVPPKIDITKVLYH